MTEHCTSLCVHTATLQLHITSSSTSICTICNLYVIVLILYTCCNAKVFLNLID